jgi:hypothetical protein
VIVSSLIPALSLGRAAAQIQLMPSRVRRITPHSAHTERGSASSDPISVSNRPANRAVASNRGRVKEKGQPDADRTPARRIDRAAPGRNGGGLRRPPVAAKYACALPEAASGVRAPGYTWPSATLTPTRGSSCPRHLSHVRGAGEQPGKHRPKRPIGHPQPLDATHPVRHFPTIRTNVVQLAQRQRLKGFG